MDLYKPLCKHVVMPLWAKWEGTPYLRHLKELEKTQYAPVETVREAQWERITGMLDHAYENCRYYRERFSREGIHPRDIRTFEDFRSVPLLTKGELLERSEDLLASNVPWDVPFLTSGSTGKPLRGFRDKACAEFKRACGRRSELWSGYDLGERVYCLYGDPEREKTGFARLKARLRRKLLLRIEILDMLRLTDPSLRAFARKMQRRPPSLLWGHAHGLYLLACFLEAQGIGGIRPKGMYSAGMVLHDYEREKVEKVFGCRLQDRYGTEELGLIATECKRQQGLHVNTDCHYVEFLGPEGRPVAPGERGAIVVTDLTNRAMPFIRYKVEDVGVPSDRRCDCGRTQPLISRIEGRIADFLVTPNGELVSGISLSDHFAGHIPGVAQIQIVQEEVDLLVLNVVPGGGFGAESRAAAAALVRAFFGESMRVRFVLMDGIPQGPTGKYRFTICKVRHGLLG